MTLPQLRRMLEKRMLIGQVQQREVMSHIDITDAEEKAYYDAHKSEFATTPSVTLREIMVAVPADPKGVNAAANDAAQKKAEAIRARVAGGEAFDKVATEVSDAPSKANGGLIGPIPKTELAEDLAKLLATMKVGRRHAGGARAGRLRNSQARSRPSSRRRCRSSRRRPDCRQARRRAAGRRDAEISQEAARRRP